MKRFDVCGGIQSESDDVASEKKSGSRGRSPRSVNLFNIDMHVDIHLNIDCWIIVGISEPDSASSFLPIRYRTDYIRRASPRPRGVPDSPPCSGSPMPCKNWIPGEYALLYVGLIVNVIVGGRIACFLGSGIWKKSGSRGRSPRSVN